mgnify:CR=1 FL=1
MDADLLIKAFIALAPVVLLLAVFDRLDAFNLISAREIAILLGVGGAAAAFSFLANLRVMDGFPIGFSAFSRYVSPIIEESLKAAPIIYLFARNRLVLNQLLVHRAFNHPGECEGHRPGAGPTGAVTAVRGALVLDPLLGR